MAEEENDKPSALEELANLERQHLERVASFKLAGAKAGTSPVKLPLVQPFEDSTGVKVSELNVRPYTMQDVFKAQEDGEDGSKLRLFATITHLAPDDVTRLSPPDWEALEAISEGFQMRLGGGPQAR